jgi:hypothetical protein
MLTLIIIIAVAIFSIGALKSMTSDERSIVIRRTLNLLTFGIVYLFRAGKEGSKITYQAGRVAGATLSLEGQDTIHSMAEHNKTVADKGGAAREAIRTSQAHGNTLGLSNISSDLKKKADELDARLEAKRKELKEKYGMTV